MNARSLYSVYDKFCWFMVFVVMGYAALAMVFGWPASIFMIMLLVMMGLNTVVEFFYIRALRKESSPNHDFRIGDIVMVKPGLTFVLHCGSGIYPTAIVVNLDPFVLVSRSTDMLWRATIKPEYFLKIEAADASVVKRCLERYEYDKKKNLI